jgi:putative ABC transport system permease protein
MSWYARIATVFGGTFRRKRLETEMDAELRFHITSFTGDLVRSGITLEEAERRARVEFGQLEPLKEECRQARGLRLWDETVQDLRYAGRMLSKSPGFAITAILTLAVGIGANTAIFSTVNTFVLKPLPYANPEQLVSIASTDAKGRWVENLSAADLNDWRTAPGAFEYLCGWQNPIFTLERGDAPERIPGARVNWDFFRMLGVAPQSGRSFLAEEDQPGAAPVAIVSHELWQSHFGSEAGLIGQTILLNGKQTTVVGILPPGFHLPLMGTAGIWTPLALSEAERANRKNHNLRVIARVKPGLSLGSAFGYLRTLNQRLAKSYPDSNSGRTVQMLSLSDEIGKEGARDQTLIVFGLVSCVLLIACFNVANLIVGRAAGRQKEMAVRLAIGAGRSRLLRQLLAENLLLFITAAALSALFAIRGVEWIANSIPPNIRGYLPNSGVVRVDLPTLLYTVGIALFTGILFGFAPAFHCWRIDVNHALKQTTALLSGGKGTSSLKNALIVFETSLALVVLIAAGLLIKGLVRMYGSDPGLNAHGLVTGQIVLSDPKYADPKQSKAFVNTVLEQLQGTPGISAVAAGTSVPFSGNSSVARYAIAGRPAPAPADLPLMLLDVVTPNYLSTMGVQLLRGRGLNEQDRSDGPAVAVINQTMAQRHWPGQDPIGQGILWNNLSRTLTVAGVVKDTAGYGETDTPQPHVYLPYAQLPQRGLFLIARTDSTVLDIAAVFQRALRSADKGQAVFRVETMEQLMTEQRAGKSSEFVSRLEPPVKICWPSWLDRA